MGCDIHIVAERRTETGYEAIKGVKFTQGPSPFDWREYGLYGFLAGVRNYSEVPQISEPRDLPDDASPESEDEAEHWSGDAHSHSYVTVEELLAHDYDATFVDRRDGDAVVSLREFLSQGYFADLKVLQEVGADRIVFFFDN